MSTLRKRGLLEAHGWWVRGKIARRARAAAAAACAEVAPGIEVFSKMRKAWVGWWMAPPDRAPNREPG